MMFSSSRTPVSEKILAGALVLTFLFQQTALAAPLVAYAEETVPSADQTSQASDASSTPATDPAPTDSSASSTDKTSDASSTTSTTTDQQAPAVSQNFISNNQQQGGDHGNNGDNNAGDQGHDGDNNHDGDHGHDGDGHDGGHHFDPCVNNQLTITSGTSDRVGGTLVPAALVQTPYNDAWTAIIPAGAQWIWSTPTVQHPTQDETFSFIKKFTVSGIASSSSLVLAADNNYSVSLNGHLIGSNDQEFNYKNDATYVVDPAYFYNGMNTLIFTIKNIGLENATPQSNPAGVVYSLSVSSRSCPNDPHGPANHAPTITLLGANPLTLAVGDAFVDPGATGADAEDGALTPVVTGSVDTGSVSTTTLTYTVTDTEGASASVTRTVYVVPADSIEKQNQTISFDEISDKTYGAPDFTVEASTTSGLPATFTVSGDCSLVSTSTASALIHIVQAGSCSVTAHQNGDSSFNAAAPVTQNFDISKLTIFISASGVDKPYDGNTVANVQLWINSAVNGDNLTATATAAFDGPEVGSHGVTVSNIQLSGDHASSYAHNDGWLTQANITGTTTDGGPGDGNATNTAPTITLLGANPIVLTVGETFIDPGASSTDAQDGDLTSHILVTGGTGTTSDSIDTSVVSTTTLTYTVTDAGGLSASTTRTVIVNPAAATSTNPSNNGGDNNGNNGGSTGSTSSGGSSSSSGSFVSPIFASVPTFSTTSVALTCPLITTFMQIGGANDSADVLRLQTFLKHIEGLDVDQTGIFDQKTEAGVKAFQAKYLSDIMGPWHASAPTGYVYITTKKKINQIACNYALTFTPDEQAVINAYLAGQQNGQTGQTGTSSSPIIGATENQGSNGSSTNPIIGETGNGNSNTAAAANSSILSRFWNFIKNLF